MSEKEFITRFKNELLKQNSNVFWYKIPDSVGGRFQIPKPFDVTAIIHGLPVAIEFKYKKTESCANYKDLRDSQKSGLEAFEKAGGHAFVVFGFTEQCKCLITDHYDLKLAKGYGRKGLYLKSLSEAVNSLDVYMSVQRDKMKG